VSRVRLYRATGIVLSARDLGETDRVLSILSRERGKISAVAKGAKRPTSKLAASSQPFCCSAFQFAEGRNLDVATQAVPRNAFYPIRSGLQKIAYASYFGELVNAFTEERSPSPRLFDLLLAALSVLSSSADDKSAAPLARAFELRLLALSGYAPQLASCSSCGRKVRGGAFLSNAAGGVLCSSCAVERDTARYLSAGALAAMRLLAKSSPSSLPNISLTRAQSAELEGGLRCYVEYHLDRKIKSARFLHEFAKR